MDQIRYEVRDQAMGAVISTHRIEERAIAKAKKVDGKVVMVSKSGTVVSTTVLYPKHGPTYSS